MNEEKEGLWGRFYDSRFLPCYSEGSYPVRELELKTCQYCGDNINAYWFKHHNCPEKIKAISDR